LRFDKRKRVKSDFDKYHTKHICIMTPSVFNQKMREFSESIKTVKHYSIKLRKKAPPTITVKGQIVPFNLILNDDDDLEINYEEPKLC